MLDQGVEGGGDGMISITGGVLVDQGANGKVVPVSVVSVITPVYKPVPEHLVAAYESLVAQVLPDGWS